MKFQVPSLFGPDMNPEESKDQLKSQDSALKRAGDLSAVIDNKNPVFSQFSPLDAIETANRHSFPDCS